MNRKTLDSVFATILFLTGVILAFFLMASLREVETLKEKVSLLQTEKKEDRDIIQMWEKRYFETRDDLFVWKKRALKLEEELEQRNGGGQKKLQNLQ